MPVTRNGFCSKSTFYSPPCDTRTGTLQAAFSLASWLLSPGATRETRRQALGQKRALMASPPRIAPGRAHVSAAEVVPALSSLGHIENPPCCDSSRCQAGSGPSLEV